MAANEAADIYYVAYALIFGNYPGWLPYILNREILKTNYKKINNICLNIKDLIKIYYLIVINRYIYHNSN